MLIINFRNLNFILKKSQQKFNINFKNYLNSKHEPNHKI